MKDTSYPPYGRDAPAEYLAAVEGGQPTIPWCAVCQRHFFYPRPLCPRCHSDSVSYPPFEETMTVKAAAWVWRPHYDVFNDELPIALLAAGTDDFTLIAEGRGWSPEAPIDREAQARLGIERRADGGPVPVLLSLHHAARNETGQ